MYKDTSGNILLTDVPRTDMSLKSVSAGDENNARPVLVSYNQSAYDNGKFKYFTRYSALISRAAKKYKIDPKLLSAVIQVESQFNPQAVSRTGAVGLMQLMPETAKQLGVQNRYDPSQNIEGGAKYLRYLIERFEGNLEHAIASYNAGPLNVEKYGKVPPFKETKRYVTKVFDIYKGKKNIDLAKNGGNTIYRYKLDDGTIVYTDHPMSGPQKF